MGPAGLIKEVEDSTIAFLGTCWPHSLVQVSALEQGGDSFLSSLGTWVSVIALHVIFKAQKQP